MDDAQREHPDEGTIHAWLDGALDDASARALAAHVASCRVCAERVAEARGLIAGASRIVSTLDDAPTLAGPAWGQSAAPAVAVGGGSAWQRLRVTPARAAIAATVLVALGVSLTYKRAAVETDASRMRTMVADSTAAAPAMAPSPVPPRSVGPATRPAPMAPQVGTSAAAMADRTAPTRVAAGRAAVMSGRDSTAGTVPDQLAGRANASVRSAGAQVAAAAVRADSVVRLRGASVVAGNEAAAPALPAPRVLGLTPSPECYRVESANGTAATWGPVALPLVVAIGPTGPARVLSEAGAETGAEAIVTHAGEDSLLFKLRRIGFEGTLALGARGDARAGVMRSRPLQTMLESVVTTAAPAPDEAREVRRARLPAAKSVPTPTSAAAAESDARRAAVAAPAMPVVARRISCPG